jgi:hypothetical protein
MDPDKDDLIAQLKKSIFDISCIMLIFVLFFHLRSAFHWGHERVNYERFLIYGICLVVCNTLLRRFKKPLSTIFIMALFIGLAGQLFKDIAAN